MSLIETETLNQLRHDLVDAARPTPIFFIMNGLAAIIAGYGLLLNSPAVVIGAMLIAMLLGPISATAFAILEARITVLKQALLTLAGGVLLVVAVGIGLGLLHAASPLTPEIMSRTRPNLMDLMVALAGGAAGALAMISPRLSAAVVGVAVATALVPPLVAGGILLAHGQWRPAGGAFLLTLTNIVAIGFSTSMVLWTSGLKRLEQDEQAPGFWVFLKRNFFSLMLLGGLALYLTYSLNQSLAQQRYENNLAKILESRLQQGQNLLVSQQTLARQDYRLVRVVVRGDVIPTMQQLDAIEPLLPRDPQGRISRLQVRFVPVGIIQSSQHRLQPLDAREAVAMGEQVQNTP